MTAVFAFSYAISFAAISAVIMHTILYNGLLINKRLSFSIELFVCFIFRQNYHQTISIFVER